MAEANFNLEFDLDEYEDENNPRFGSKTKSEQDKIMDERHRDNTR